MNKMNSETNFSEYEMVYEIIFIEYNF